ncbi:MAG: translation elongation factor Ts [Gammaproteobacteria bacterium]|jgi:elongation factor Ts
MSNITAQMVKELRDRTGAGMMECKKALTEAEGNMDLAVDAMRKAGQAKADKKSSRIAAEGVISLSMNDRCANMVEVNCETDFVAKDENFLEFVNIISNASLESYSGKLDDFNKSSHSSGKTIEEIRLELVSKVGENVKIRRIKSFEKNNAYIGHYMHGNKIGVVVTLEKENENLAKDICMHVAAMKPAALNSEDISNEDLDKEREIFMAQAKESGKPEDIAQKMVEGKIKKYISEVTLLNQPFVKDNDIKISDLLDKNDNKILSFYRMEVGEGIEKKDENFADEVMSQIKN